MMDNYGFETGTTDGSGVVDMSSTQRGSWYNEYEAWKVSET